MKAELNNPGGPLDDQLDSVRDLSGDRDDFGSTTVIPNDLSPTATADSRVQVGSLLRDRFLLKEKVSGGSMGVVYKALDRRLAEAEVEDPWVAIKVLSPQLAANAHALRALQQEAAKGRCLLHPNIVRFLDFDREDDLYFLVLEWMHGRTLADILDSTDARSVDKTTAFDIVAQIGNALEYAHRCGIVHADVKPANIMIMPDGNAKLFDFGIARIQQSRSKRDDDSSALGALTPAYSSMQVLTGEDPAPADDVFSLACLLYRLLAGHRVFGPRNAAEASSQGMQPQRPQGLSDPQWSALKKALSYSRVTRYASVQAFTDALKAGNDAEIIPIIAERPGHDAEIIPVLSDEIAAPAPARKSNRTGTLLLLLLLVGSAALYQYGVPDRLLEALEDSTAGVVVEEQTVNPLVTETTIRDARVDARADFAAADAPVSAPLNDAMNARIDEPPAPEPLIDFSVLPAADLEVPFTLGKRSGESFRIALREDGRPMVVDFVRDAGLGQPLVLKLDEVGFSGNRSPWGSRQYSFSAGGVLRFPAGQPRSRVTLTMASDPLREADQLSTLRLREIDSVESELAVIYVALEDDDQRTFEAQLPANTIGFAASQASIRERDPAVQIDVVRFNPDNSRVVIGYTVQDVTATEGKDYFAPSNRSITFGPGQRSARLLIPLVQDSLVEGDEAFVIELSILSEVATDNVYKRIVVMIRDDEPQ